MAFEQAADISDSSNTFNINTVVIDIDFNFFCLFSYFILLLFMEFIEKLKNISTILPVKC